MQIRKHWPQIDGKREIEGEKQKAMVTVLLCTYNGEAYIRAQIQSILDQTVQDLQLVVSDDGSTDGTLAIVEEMAAAHPGRITILRQNPPTGSAQRHFLKLLVERAYDVPKTGIALKAKLTEKSVKQATDAATVDETRMRADYIMLSDQDDVWLPEKVEKTLFRMQALEAGCRAEGEANASILVHCDSRIVDRELREIAPSFVAYQKMTPSRCHLHQLLVQNNVVGGALMMNRALASRITELPEHCVMHDQWIALIASAFGHIDFLPESLYLYRQHGDNVLGAGKGSRIMEVLGRFGIGRKDGKTKAEMDAHSQSVYREMFLQAACFRRTFDATLSGRQKKLLEQFMSIPKRNRIGKIYTILRYGFTYNLFHRTVGECLFIQ